MTDVATIVADEREQLVGLAYRILGSVAEAEDAVQDAFLRLADQDLSTIERPGAWLATVTGRICLDRLRSARHRREAYVGPWLPEPLVTSGDVHDFGASGPAGEAELAESVTVAFLLVLESLSPAERVAFVLHDVFGYGYDDVAAALDRSPAACRQLVSRARAAVRARRPRFDADPSRRDRAAELFLTAARTGDVAPLLDVLAPDVVLHSDGGGIASAARRPVTGADRVIRFLAGVAAQAPAGFTLAAVEVNGAPGLLARDPAGRPDTVFTLQVEEGRITAIYAVRNPEKLAHLVPSPPAP